MTPETVSPFSFRWLVNYTSRKTVITRMDSDWLLCVERSRGGQLGTQGALLNKKTVVRFPASQPTTSAEASISSPSPSRSSSPSSYIVCLGMEVPTWQRATLRRDLIPSTVDAEDLARTFTQGILLAQELHSCLELQYQTGVGQVMKNER